ncbi:MAG TPA: tRNA lysidine(34) synthetase TilS [Candidatus Binatus sp.]|nr:tRNA lysidine(34) synthetase TilS [Candidatus Binatus sp.]
MQLAGQIEKFAIANDLIAAGDRILVAVSGGPDSVALLHLLRELREALQLHLEVAHLQHGIRGAAAKEDAAFVAQSAAQLAIPFHLKEVNLPQLRSAAGKGNLEALAREQRYRFFADVVAAHRLDKVATAHTLDDQAETVLMWFLRGSGLNGLGGMAPLSKMNLPESNTSSSLTIIRPLLETSKQELLNYLSENKLSYRRDHTNQDPALLRNWLRLELLPKIQERVYPRLNQRLAQQAKLIRDEEALLNDLTRQKLSEIRRPNALSRDLLVAQPIALQRRLLRFWIAETRGNLRGVDFVHIDAALRLIKDGAPQSRLAIPGGWELAREYDEVKLLRLSANLKPQCYDYDLIVGKTLQIPEAVVEIRSEIIKAPLERYPTDLSEAVFDYDTLTGPLTVRNFRHGDFYQPLGMTGHKKIKELFIEKKVGLSVRANWPLLALAQEVLWVPGYARSEVAKVTAQTAVILRLKLVSLST